jgi:hypothetical protein
LVGAFGEAEHVAVEYHIRYMAGFLAAIVVYVVESAGGVEADR